jgi:hypothetical protein
MVSRYARTDFYYLSFQPSPDDAGLSADEITDDRNYFSWNLSRYPSPSDFGHTVETELEVQVVVNMKPWLLETHPMLQSAEDVGAFVRAPGDALGDEERASKGGSQKDWVWSSGFAAHAPGRYFDYSESMWVSRSTTLLILAGNRFRRRFKVVEGRPHATCDQERTDGNVVSYR